jgi:thioesterase domain-containing protein
VRLIARLRKELAGGELPLAVLFEAPTIEQLARRLSEGGAGSAALAWSPLVPLQPRGDGEPFFCVHAIGGGVMRYYGPLARWLGDDQPFYAFQAPGLDRHGEAPQPSIAELAARYVAAMREIRPCGPYFLGGASFGGIVAFEMAQQLRGQGEEVALLALIDTLLAGADTADPAFDEAAFCADMAQMLARQEGVALALDADELRGLPHAEMLERLLARLRAAGLAGEDLDLPWMDRYIAGFKARMAAASAYRPRRYPGEISLFRAQRAHLGKRTAPAVRLARGSLEDPALGWGRLAAQGVRVHQLRGTHETMLREPHVRQLASLLRWSIDRGRAAVGAGSVAPSACR